MWHSGATRRRLDEARRDFAPIFREFFIADWLRNRNTVEFLGIWESVFNPGFNYGEFATIKSQAGLNSYKISVKEWVEKTNAIGLKATAGRYGGTYAHPEPIPTLPSNLACGSARSSRFTWSKNFAA